MKMVQNKKEFYALHCHSLRNLFLLNSVVAYLKVSFNSFKSTNQSESKMLSTLGLWFVICCLISDSIIDPDNPKVECTYHYPSFSKQCSWMSLMCQGPFLPTVSMVDVKQGRVFRPLAENSASRSNLKERDQPINVYYNVPSDGFNISVKETRPPDFDPKKKYAVLFDVYGGPNTQKVSLCLSSIWWFLKMLMM